MQITKKNYYLIFQGFHPQDVGIIIQK